MKEFAVIFTPPIKLVFFFTFSKFL